MEQESLANAKVSARSSACMKGPSEEIYDKSTQGTLKSTLSGLQRALLAIRVYVFIRLAVAASKISEIPRDSLKTSNW